MTWMPGATRRPITVNYTPGGQAEVRGVVVHIMAGTLAGTDSWFRNPAARASSHFGTGKAGQLYQWISARDRAWAQGSGNPYWLSVENEGKGGDTLTTGQLDRNAQVLAWAHKLYGVPLKVADGPYGRGLGFHAMGGAAWGGHTACPGPRIVAQLPEIVRRAKLIVNGEEDPMAGITTKDIAKAVWCTDGIIDAPTTSTTRDTNPEWQARSVLSDIVNRVRATEVVVRAQSATIKALADAIAAQSPAIDPTVLVAQVTAAVDTAVSRATADVVEPDPPAGDDGTDG